MIILRIIGIVGIFGVGYADFFTEYFVVINEYFTGNGNFGEFIFYRYDNVWYIHWMRMDDDLSIDFLGKDVTIYTDRIEITGKIIGIGEYYLLLDSGVYFAVPDTQGLKVGDNVKVSANNDELRGGTVDDPNGSCRFYCAFEITAAE